MTHQKNEDCDPLDSVLDLEETFFQEGYSLGLADGERAGRIEGRAFGLEKGFEKYTALGRLHGKAQVWAGTLDEMDETNKAHRTAEGINRPSSERPAGQFSEGSSQIPVSQTNPRLQSHVRTLFALTEPGSLSVENTEESVADFDHRLKRAEGKVKVIEKLKHGVDPHSKGFPERETSRSGQKITRQGSIEDIHALNSRG